MLYLFTVTIILSKELQLRHSNFFVLITKSLSIVRRAFLITSIMKIKFKKDHIDIKEGDVVEMTDAQANYFIRVGIGHEYKERKTKRKTKELKTNKKTK